MKILVIGNGGREHSICDALSRSAKSPEIYNFATSINPGIKNLTKKIFIGNILNLEELKKIIKQETFDLAIIGPDDPIGIGAADILREANIPTFAPSKKCAQIESSKSFTRNLLKKYKINASPKFFVSTKIEEHSERQNFFDEFDGQIVVKADGLLGGKGVLVGGDHFNNFVVAENFAKQSIEKFGKVVLEEKLVGEEFSLMSIVDGTTVLDTPAIQDNKRAFEGDTGPNTGGLGCISDENGSLPFLNNQNLKDAHNITVQVMKALEEELGEKYQGVLYGGFIVTKNGVKLIEYNARFGDPEALNLFSTLKNDALEIFEKASHGRLNEIKKLEFEKKATVVKYLCPEGYPDNPTKDEPIEISDIVENIENGRGKIYFASVSEERGRVVLRGSRAIGICGIGDDFEEALKNCEQMISYFSGPLFYRKDIGTKELIEKRITHMKEILM